MEGDLGVGDLVVVGLTATAYSNFMSDITNIVITAAGAAYGSAPLDYLASIPMAQRHIDFELSLQGGPKTIGFDGMLDQGATGIVYGRNIIQHENPEAITRALMGIVHDDLTVDQALAFLS